MRIFGCIGRKQDGLCAGLPLFKEKNLPGRAENEDFEKMGCIIYIVDV